MNKKVLFVGDCDESLAVNAKHLDSSASLIDQNNYKKWLDDTFTSTAYTSLADLPKDASIFYDLIMHADEVRYCPPAQWSNTDVGADIFPNTLKQFTEFYLHTANKIKNHVVGLKPFNYSLDTFLNLADTRRSKDIQLWAVGCSTTAGVGINPDQSYATLLAKKLNLPLSTLAVQGSSISWAADQILRSDIKADDVVVWGLTEENRLTLWDEDLEKPAHITIGYKNAKSFPSNLLDKLLIHKTNFFLAIQRISEVINFCKKTNAKLLIFPVHSSHLLNVYLYNLKEFVPYIYKSMNFSDRGTDNLHPGPKQHQLYADFCQTQLKRLYNI